MSGEQVARRPDRTPLSQRDPVALAQHFFQSGFFGDVQSMSQAVVKIVAGEELGLGPMTSMQGIHIIKGKPTMSANLHAVQVKRSENYNFRPVETTAEKARIEWFEDGQSVGFSEFTIEQAETAGLIKSDSGWTRYPEDMLFARALTRGMRRFCPEVSAGSPAYTPEELGAEVDEQGEPLPGQADEPASETAAPIAALPPERIVPLVEGIEIAKPKLAEAGVNWWDGLNVVLGSINIDGFDFSVSREVEDHLVRLTVGQADALDAELQRMADEDAEEVNGEVVEEAPDA
jgi:hypothetical protein